MVSQSHETVRDCNIFLYAHSHLSTIHTITSPNRPITHAMSIIMLRTTHNRKMKYHHAFRVVEMMTKPKVVYYYCCCCCYYILYEKFIKLGKLRDGNLCALNLYWIPNGLNLAIQTYTCNTYREKERGRANTCEPRSHFVDWTMKRK